MKDKEIEIQVKIENKEHFLKFLEQNAKFISENNQIDEYFIPAHRDFLIKKPIEEWFRLRNESGKYSMTYKKWHYNKEGIGEYADEYETTITDIESARKIIIALDCKSITVVNKTRKKYFYKNYEIAFDTVKGLGDFVEMEYKSEEILHYKEITDDMIKFLKEQKCGKIERNNGGYPQMLLFPNEVTFISV